MSDKDPKRWQEVIIDTPFARLTKKEIYDYYSTPKIQKAILDAVGHREAVIRQSFAPGQNVLRRKDERGSFVRLDKGRLDLWNEKRLSEVHPTFGKKVDTLLADIDPQEDVPWQRTKQITETVAKTMSSHPAVKDVKIRFSGGRGFYVEGKLDTPMGVDHARNLTQQILHNVAQRPDCTFGVAKPGMVRLDTTPLKVRGSVRAPYSLNASTGLVSAPVKLEDLPNVKKEDFTIDEILRKKTAEEIRFPAGYGTAVAEGKKNTTIRMQDELGKYEAGKTYDSPWGKIHIDSVSRAKVKELRNRGITKSSLKRITQEGGKPSTPVDIIRFHISGPRVPPKSALELAPEEEERNQLIRKVMKNLHAGGKIATTLGTEATNTATPEAVAAARRKALGVTKQQLANSIPIGMQQIPGPAGEAQNALLVKVSKEFAPGIPKSRKIHSITRVTRPQKDWTLAIQTHKADIAGEHYDLRLIPPKSGKAHSWAIPKARLPEATDRMLLAIQQPTHTKHYATTFSGTIPKGTYGAGTVELHTNESVKVLSAGQKKIKFQRPNGDQYMLFRMGTDKNWGIKKLSQAKDVINTWRVKARAMKAKKSNRRTTAFIRDHVRAK